MRRRGYVKPLLITLLVIANIVMITALVISLKDNVNFIGTN